MIKMSYQEQYRPQIHYSPEKNWLNDPNGLVYLDGEYHLFYQYNPLGNDHANMHWGHAVSPDLFNWREIGVALEPDYLGTIFSGSAVVDKNNTSGLFDDTSEGMVAIFTHAADFQQQSIAYSTDKGRSWTKYKNNPVIPNDKIEDFRDPKVFWHENTQKWIMLLACGNHIQIYTSSNLIDWTYKSSFGKEYESFEGIWECPDLFSLPVEETSEEGWIMIVSINAGGPNGGSAVQYFTGSFDGENFKAFESPEDPIKWADEGKDFYASISWDNTEHKYWIGWMNNWEYAGIVPVSPWRSAMSVARQLTLVKVGEGYLLKQNPIIQGDIQTCQHEEEIIIGEQKTADFDISSPSSINIVLAEENRSKQWGMTLISNEEEEFSIVFNPKNDTYVFHRNAGNVEFSSDFSGDIKGSLKGLEVTAVRCLLDNSSVELFINDGISVSTSLFFPKGSIIRARIFSGHDDFVLHDFEINEFVSIWK